MNSEPSTLGARGARGLRRGCGVRALSECALGTMMATASGDSAGEDMGARALPGPVSPMLATGPPHAPGTSSARTLTTHSALEVPNTRTY